MIGARGREREREEGRRKLRWYRLEWKNETMEVKYKWGGEEGRGERKGKAREIFSMKFSSVNSLWFSLLRFFFSPVKSFPVKFFFFFFILCDNIFESNWIFLARTNVCFVFEILRGMDRCRDGFETDRFVKIRKQNVDRCRCDSTSGPVWYRN